MKLILKKFYKNYLFLLKYFFTKNLIMNNKNLNNLNYLLFI